MKKDTIAVLDMLMHRVERLLGEIIKEHKRSADVSERHIQDLLLAKVEIQDIIEREV
uniref:Uncharacterized protein n=1 Tax=viral metagenome TaxID=1070528 RepID=A0A6H1ZCC4_9ZZZZ